MLFIAYANPLFTHVLTLQVLQGMRLIIIGYDMYCMYF